MSGGGRNRWGWGCPGPRVQAGVEHTAAGTSASLYFGPSKEGELGLWWAGGGEVTSPLLPPWMLACTPGAVDLSSCNLRPSCEDEDGGIVAAIH